MEISVIQESFAAGEISPLTYGRYAADGYASGCKTLLNMRPDSRGPAIRREGSRFVFDFAGNKGRLFSHTVSNNFFYSIVLLDYTMTMVTPDGQTPGTNYALNSRFITLGASWTAATTGSGSVVDFQQYLTTLTVSTTPNKYSRIAQQVTVPAAGNYTVVVQTRGGAQYTVDVGTSAGDSSYGTFSSGGPETTINITTPGTTAWVTVTNFSNATSDDVEITYVGVSPNPVAAPSFATPWSEDEVKDVHVIAVPDGSASYFIHPNYAPRKLVYDIPTDAFTLSTPAFTNPPSVWAGTNWPSAGTYFQGRLWLGSTPNQPQSLWGSKSSLPEDFTPGTGLDDESISIVMASYGRVEWIAATKNLLVGTESAEHIITSSGGVLTPTDHSVDQQSAYGSASIQAQQVGDQIFYISSDRVKVRAMQYEWSKNNWLSTDLTYFSEHITQAKIKEVAWSQNPDNLFVTLLDDGTFASLSYDRSNNIYGWASHDMGDTCVAINVTTLNGKSILGMLMQRASGRLYYETDVEHENEYMDSWIEKHYALTTTTVTGLDHLNGRTVQVLTDGATHTDQVVVSGSITLTRSATDVVVGLKYVSTLGLLPVEKGSGTGTSAPYWKNYHSFDVHLLDSAHPTVNGDRAPVRSPSTPMGNPEPLTTGKSFISLLGWKNETDIIIQQDLPFPLTVLAVSGKLNQERL